MSCRADKNNDIFLGFSRRMGCMLLGFLGSFVLHQFPNLLSNRSMVFNDYVWKFRLLILIFKHFVTNNNSISKM